MNPATIELTAPDISCEKCKANIERNASCERGAMPEENRSARAA